MRGRRPREEEQERTWTHDEGGHGRVRLEHDDAALVPLPARVEEGQRRGRRPTGRSSGVPVEKVILQTRGISEGERHEESRLRTHHRVPDAASREGQSGQLSAHDMRAPTTLKYM